MLLALELEATITVILGNLHERHSHRLYRKWFSAYNLWSGLNDGTRNRKCIKSLRPSSFAYSGIGGLYILIVRAGKQRKQLSVTIGTSNRTYDLRGWMRMAGA